jgi:hypothetical protein
MALQDAQRTMGLVRFHAAEWHIDPHKIGVMGFSAGGHLVAATSVHSERIYAAVDAADKVSCRPDFAVAIYPGHLSFGEESLKTPKLNPDIASHITERGRPCGRDQPIVGLLHCAEERRGSRGDAPVCAGRARLWATTYEAAGEQVARAGGDVAGDDWDDCESF